MVLLAVFEARAASVRVTIAEPINGRSESAVQFAARVKAKDEGIAKLPVMMVVYEQIKDDSYYEQVESLAAGGAKVHVVSERFDSAGNLYHLVADVELDEALTLKLLGSIQRGQNAIRELEDLRSELAGSAQSSSRMLKLNKLDWYQELSAQKVSPTHFRKNANGDMDVAAQRKYAVEVAAKVLSLELPRYLSASHATLVTDDEIKKEMDGKFHHPLSKDRSRQLLEENRRSSRFNTAVSTEQLAEAYITVDVPGRYDLQVFAKLVELIATQTGAKQRDVGWWIGAVPCLAWYRFDEIDKAYKLDYQVKLAPNQSEAHPDANTSAISSNNVVDIQRIVGLHGLDQKIDAQKPTTLLVRFDRQMEPSRFSEHVALKVCYNNTQIFQAILANRRSDGLSSKNP
jgi:hypothetical protein